VLDDIGVEAVTPWLGATMDELIDYRYERELPTVITSNLPLDEIKRRYGARIVSRIHAMCYPVEMTGRSYRPVMGD
jgi:DNA replication protein DnaC